MPNHLIVILDRSGSMCRGFSGQQPGPNVRAETATHTTKIEEAKAQILSWLAMSSYELVTVIPFSSRTETPRTFHLPSEIAELRAFLHPIDAQGGTNLADALRVAIMDIGREQPVDQYVRYLVVTDGLSDNPDEDVQVVEAVPRDQGIDGILIDSTPEVESHLRRICIRGSAKPICGPSELHEVLADRAREDAARGDLHRQAVESVQRAGSIARELATRDRAAVGSPIAAASESAEMLARELSEAVERGETLREHIASPEYSKAQIKERLSALGALIAAGEALLRKKSEGPVPTATLAHPRKLSKGFSGLFLVQIYSRDARRRVRRRIRTVFRKTEIHQAESKTAVFDGQTIDIALTSPAVDFAPSVRKTFDGQVLEALFWGAAKESCRSGDQNGVLAIKDAATGQEITSIPFTVRVVDYAFDHIPRPLLGRALAVVTGIAAAAVYVLTFLEKLDKTLGITAGTAAMAIATAMSVGVQSVYRNPSVPKTSQGA